MEQEFASALTSNQPSRRDLRAVLTRQPNVETLGYSQASLRDDGPPAHTPAFVFGTRAIMVLLRARAYPRACRKQKENYQRFIVTIDRPPLRGLGIVKSPTPVKGSPHFSIFLVAVLAELDTLAATARRMPVTANAGRTDTIDL
jgi:hypothetical protein